MEPDTATKRRSDQATKSGMGKLVCQCGMRGSCWAKGKTIERMRSGSRRVRCADQCEVIDGTNAQPATVPARRDGTEWGDADSSMRRKRPVIHAVLHVTGNPVRTHTDATP